jgi:hypothetical protein
MTNKEEQLNFGQDDLAYPVLMIGEGYFLVHKDAAGLTRCSITAFEKSVYQQAMFIDALGNQFRVLAVEKKGYASPFLGFRLMTGRQITVALRFIKIRVLSLPEVIDVIKETINRVDWGADREFLATKIRSAKTIGDLFQGLDK